MGSKLSGRAGQLLALALVWAGCSANQYRKSADREVAAVIAQKSPRVPNMDPHFTIEQTNALTLDALPVAAGTAEYLGRDGEAERAARVLTLEQALDLAVKHSRSYQSRKESVFLQALNLTLARHQFAPIFSGGAEMKYESSYALKAVEVATGGTETPALADAIVTPKVTAAPQRVESHTRTATAKAGATMLLNTGAKLASDFSTDFLRYLAGDPGVVTHSHLGATLTQPLLRGAGYKATMENLTQAERSLLYELRNFARFRKEFSVQIATSYYRVLQSRDAARNNYLGFHSFKKSAERTRALAAEGRTKQAELGRLEQQELSQETSWIAAIRSYKFNLDTFKIQLGLSADANVVLDERELEQLTILDPQLELDEAIRVALVTRLDLYNLRDQHEDTQRAIGLAANHLKPQLDLNASAAIDSKPGKTGFVLPDPKLYKWDAGFTLDLPLERKAERNAYRTALINHEVSARALTEAEDNVKLQVREDWRSLDQARRNYQNSELGVKLAERRVEEQTLLAELGRGRAQDEVDAQNDLTTSKNQRTQTLVDHTITRLRLWADLGILFIKENGKWEEVANAKKN